MTGFYNVYNILAVYSVLREMDLPTDSFDEVLRGFKPQFGRGEVFHVGENSKQRVLLNLAKNPAGFNQNISAMLQDRSPKDLVIVINDNAQDGRDVSWLWDVDFDRLADETIRSITVSGLRALDMQLRLKYVEIESERAPAVEKAIDTQLADGSENLYVLVNYTALYEAHKYLERLQK
jgi:UDP-N-acetylmuramyl tripeptide synthase